MKPPEDIKLSREDGEALSERIQASNLRPEDQGLLVKLIRVYFWLTLALQETKISLKRLRVALFGEGRTKPKPPGGDSGGSAADGEANPSPPDPSPASSAAEPSGAEPGAEQRRGHGRWGAEVYPGAEQVVCRHDALAASQRCPACGRGTLYPVPAGVEVRIDGNALLSAVRYELERLRCSACGQGFTAALPAHAGDEKYTVRARAVRALSRYSLGVPFYRLEGFQRLLGVAVADATQWDRAERVADCAYIEEVFPTECRRVIDDLDTLFEHEASTRAQGLTAAARLAYHQEHSGPIRRKLKAWLESQLHERLVEPNTPWV